MIKTSHIKKIAPTSRHYQKTLGAISISIGFIGLYLDCEKIDNNLPDIHQELIDHCQKTIEEFGKLSPKGQILVEKKIKDLSKVWQYYTFSLVTYYAFLIPCLVDIETSLKNNLKNKHDCVFNLRKIIEKILIYHEENNLLVDEEVEYGYHLYTHWTSLFN